MDLPGPNPPVHTGQVTIAFWNIENFSHQETRDITAPEAEIHVQTVAKVINDANPTILTACEIHSPEAALALNAALSNPFPYVATTDYRYRNRPVREGMSCKRESVIYSRVPWTDIKELDFPLLNERLPIGIGRGLMKATFQINGKNVTLYTGHYKSNYIGSYDREPKLTALKNVEKRELMSELLLRTSLGIWDPLTKPIQLFIR